MSWFTNCHIIDGAKLERRQENMIRLESGTVTKLNHLVSVPLTLLRAQIPRPERPPPSSWKLLLIIHPEGEAARRPIPGPDAVIGTRMWTNHGTNLSFNTRRPPRGHWLTRSLLGPRSECSFRPASFSSANHSGSPNSENSTLGCTPSAPFLNDMLLRYI